VLNEGTSGTIFETWTSRSRRSQHYTTRLSRRRCCTYSGARV